MNAKNSILEIFKIYPRKLRESKKCFTCLLMFYRKKKKRKTEIYSILSFKMSQTQIHKKLCGIFGFKIFLFKIKFRRNRLHNLVL